jgi:hypothetical protein
LGKSSVLLNVVEIATSKVEYFTPPKLKTIAKLVKLYVNTKNKALEMDGIIKGNSMFIKVLNFPAPSILAVSIKLAGTLLRASDM